MDKVENIGAHNEAFEHENGDDHKLNNIVMGQAPKVSGSKQTIDEKAYTLELDSMPPPNPTFTEKIQIFFESHKREMKIAWVSLMNLLVGIYFAWATFHYIDRDRKNECDGMDWCDGYGMLVILTAMVYVSLLYFNVIQPMFGQTFSRITKPLRNKIGNLFQYRYFSISIVGLLLILFGVYVAFDTIGSRERLRSLMGIFILYGVGFVFSVHPKRVNWRPVLCGALFQFLTAVFCIRMEIGRKIFACIGQKVAKFFTYADSGTSFVYGTYLIKELAVFAFAVLPVLFFFSFLVSILYYYGAMQWVIKKLGSSLQTLIGTTLCESVYAAGNTFLGMSESTLLIAPYIKLLTASELHVIMTSGFANVSGSVLVAYMSFGAEPSHLITSSIMAAPATLAFSKLIYPETEVSQTKSTNDIHIDKHKESSVLDAASNGAYEAVNLVAGIIANLIAFVSFIAFLNGLVGWLGFLVGHEYVSIEWFCGKLFIPLSYILGIQYEDCEKIGEVIATKTIINEFVAYQKLGELKKAKSISLRSAAIATFAICGFANLSSLGMMLGSLGTLCPEKKPVVTSIAVRTLVSGSIVCFINASIAGLLMTEDSFFDT